MLALFIPRAFCRYACPLGAFNGLFNSFSFISIKRDATTCTDCGRCTKACPVNIDVCAGATVRSVECMRCLKCVDACPVNSRAGDTLKLRTWFSGLTWPHRATTPTPTGAVAGASHASRRRSVSTWVLAGVAIAAFALPILIANLTGDFEISGDRGGSGDGGGAQESIEPGTDGEAGEPATDGSTADSQEVRGITTLAEIQATGVDLGELLNEFGIPPTPRSTRCSGT